MSRRFRFTALAAPLVAALASCAATGAGEPDDRGAAPAPAPRLERVERAADGLPYYLRGDLGRLAAPLTDLASVPAALARALPPVASAFGVSVGDLIATRIRRDTRGMTHVWFAQQIDGLPVVGGELVLHITADGAVRQVSGTARDPRAWGVTAAPSYDADAAIAAAIAATPDGQVDRGTPRLTYVIATGDGSIHLAWQVEVTGRAGVLRDDLVFVDAHDARVIDRHPLVFTAKNRTIFDGHDGVYPFVFDQTQIGSEGSPPTGDNVARAAYNNTGSTYDCYSQLYDRDSYDGAGGELKSLVHVSFFTGTGSTGNNAAWTGDQMVYGDGDGDMFRPLALAFDVTAHELTHGVTSATANLAYQNESGALNEAWSDIMAARCEAWKDGAVGANTWLIGEDIFTPGTAGDALRYMADPMADWDLYPPEIGGSRDFYADRYTGTQDNGGVHLNSGIANLAFELLVVGGTHPRGKTTFPVPSIGMDHAGAIFEHALTMGFLTMNSNFAQARTATEEVAADLYPGDEIAVGTAWAAVGIGAPPVGDTTPPTVSITAPADGATVDPGFAVAVQANDAGGVVRVELAIDGAAADTDTTAPYAFTTDATLAPGAHTLEATAYDGAGNHASDSITVTIPDPSECPSGCGADEVCQDGVCVPNGNPGDDTPGDDMPGDDAGGGAGCGCATGGADGAAGSAVFALALLVGLTRRRRR